MPKLRRPPGYKGSGAEVMIGGPLTTIGPAAIPLKEGSKYLRQLAGTTLDDLLRVFQRGAKTPEGIGVMQGMQQNRPLASSLTGEFMSDPNMVELHKRTMLDMLPEDALDDIINQLAKVFTTTAK